MCGVAERFGMPWLVVRALSDRAGEESVTDFAAFVSYAAAAPQLVRSSCRSSRRRATALGACLGDSPTDAVVMPRG